MTRTDLSATQPDATALLMLRAALLAVAMLLFRNQQARERRKP